VKKTFSLIALAAVVALPGLAGAQTAAAAPAAQVATTGKMLYAADGKRVAAVYRVQADGSPQIILQGKLVTVPVSTVTVDGGKVVTTLTKAELATR
jgi:hypothetical protein